MDQIVVPEGPEDQLFSKQMPGTPRAQEISEEKIPTMMPERLLACAMCKRLTSNLDLKDVLTYSHFKSISVSLPRFSAVSAPTYK